METKSSKSQKSRKRKLTADEDPTAPLPLGMQKTREVRSSDIQRKEPSNTFTPMETGQPDPDEIPDIHNPQGVQGGRGPLNEEGQGDRQNDELAELEEMEPNLDKPD